MPGPVSQSYDGPQDGPIEIPAWAFGDEGGPTAETNETYTVRLDPADSERPWQVLDSKGDLWESFGTKAEALAEVAERWAIDKADTDEQARHDAEEEEAEKLRQYLKETIEGLNLAELNELADSLGV